MNFSTEITVSGQPVIINVPKDSMAWNKANSIFCPLGPNYSSACLVMTREAVDALDPTASHTIIWKQEADESGINRTLNFQGFRLLKSERVLQGGSSPAALQLVEFVDARYILDKTSSTGPIRANLRSYAHDDDYLTGTTTYGTWTALVEKLWTDCGLLGAYPGLPAGLPLDGVPEGHWLIGLNAWRTICALLDQLDCAVAHNPLLDQYNIVQLGGAQEIADYTDRLKWSGEPIRSKVDCAATVRVHFFFHNKAYGQERDTELDTNWVVQGASDVIDVATGIEGATGVKMLWDDQPWILDELGAHTNNADNTTRADNRKSRYVTRHSIEPKHQILSGLINDCLPGAQVKGVVWRNFNVAEGTVTEYVAGPSLVLDYREGNFVWFDKEIVTPENEQYGPPDYGRHTYANYPRLPNIVQVDVAGAQAGDRVTANVDGLFRGKVQRWVHNAMEAVDDPLYCWILFVDDYDNKAGNVDNIIQGDYFGPARLSGVTTSNGARQPVYVVRSSTSTPLVFFELAEDKSLTTPNPVQAKVLTFNGTTWVDSGTRIDLYDDYKKAPSTSPGFFTGEADIDRGWCSLRRRKQDAEVRDKYTIIWMTGPAHTVYFTLTQSRFGDSTEGLFDATASASTDFFPYGHGYLFDQQSFKVFFREDSFTTAIVGCRGRAIYNDRARRYEVFECEGIALYGYAILAGDMCGAGAAVTAFACDSPYPHNKLPKGVAGFDATGTAGAVNNFCLEKGRQGDLVLVEYMASQQEYSVVQVQKHEMLVPIDFRFDTSRGCWQFKRIMLALEFCQDPAQLAWEDIVCGSTCP
jgi:hypothetical protein